jgi:hypothetical protein
MRQDMSLLQQQLHHQRQLSSVQRQREKSVGSMSPAATAAFSATQNSIIRAPLRNTSQKFSTSPAAPAGESTWAHGEAQRTATLSPAFRSARTALKSFEAVAAKSTPPQSPPHRSPTTPSMGSALSDKSVAFSHIVPRILNPPPGSIHIPRPPQKTTPVHDVSVGAIVNTTGQVGGEIDIGGVSDLGMNGMMSTDSIAPGDWQGNTSDGLSVNFLMDSVLPESSRRPRLPPRIPS